MYEAGTRETLVELEVDKIRFWLSIFAADAHQAEALAVADALCVRSATLQ
ncbi:hypothetical protein [Nannocystis punicea]|uniref:Uncharacterized protein n=1 Tax=Nannocystis punicea TaxID=2995304 RepID=A0ABY7H8T7_9BACT|nr:hypothetical protein [Nannocystis poenicansa]WAS95683.1 hypothetical protein O0S08_05930 [Nannocystis poenicansa]